jgi:hypothetical protein
VNISSSSIFKKQLTVYRQRDLLQKLIVDVHRFALFNKQARFDFET